MSEAVPKILKVLIGQVHLTRPPNLMEAVLGSCVGVAIFDEKDGIAGLAHVFLPDSGGKPAETLPGKYADHAVESLVEGIRSHGGNGKLRAKIAGGARMFGPAKEGAPPDVGTLNIAATREALKRFDIPIIGADTGGTCGRRVCFNPANREYLVESFNNERRIL